ncbi:DUF1772 domain-containing protein [Pyxidicoccus parkwayensis]|uniref:DUF1772 domain-containing protein n=1 Tax=Pyxidicoccus parkwayensis TaxID=2813578 RepID=A0ABX7P4Z6_9BACT|nr:anthrone oxygenase family protein [Pyxidicoccus parkwaysis]QSQ25521.1 DUF1772 domain-containing protein [Pyxidicoccus parkwaysis]
MLSTTRLVCTWLSALGSGVVAGVFFAFSAFVMQGLARLPPAQGMHAMQSINVTAVTPAFMSVLFGTAVAAVAAGVSALLSWQKPGSGWLLLGGVLYVLGGVVVTAAFNVPRNDALAAIEPARADAALLWERYVSGWTAWNHVRTVAALGATVCFILALRASPE